LPNSSRLARVLVLIRKLSAEMQQLDLEGSDSGSEEESDGEDASDVNAPREVPIASVSEHVPVSSPIKVRPSTARIFVWLMFLLA
jgi:hypothetical protein